ncbi:MAG: ABC transporter substrate-binding protein [Sarcina sp.]
MKRTLLKKGLVLSLVLASTVSIFAGCGGGTASKQAFSGSTTSKVFRTSGGYDLPETLHANPMAPPGLGNIGDYVYERLMDYVPLPDKTYMPVLAESYKEEGNVVTMKLRKGVTWNDGKPFTSKDVITTTNLGFLNNWVIWDHLEKIEAPDDHTVVFTFKQANVLTTQLAANIVINAPHHIYSKWADQAAEIIANRGEKANGAWPKETIDAMQKVKDDFYAFKPEATEAVGTGPFTVQNVTSSEAILKKNPNYWANDNVKFEEIKIVRFTNLESYMNTVMAGGYDVETQGMSPDVYKQITDKNKDMKIVMAPDLSQPSLQFNMKIAPMDNVNVRKAIQYAVDREVLFNIAEPGSAAADEYSSGMVPPMRDKFLSPEAKSKMEVYSNNTEKAETLLTEIGWKRDANGKWLDETGKLVQLEIATTSAYPTFFLTSDAITNQLNDFGLSTTLKSMETSAYWKYVGDGNAMMSISLRPGSPQYGEPWEVYRSFFFDGAVDMGFVKAEEKKAGLNNVVVTLPDGSKLDANTELNKLLNAKTDEEKIAITSELATTLNSLSTFMPLVTKYIPNKIYNPNLTGYPEDANDALWYGAASQRVFVRLMREGKLEYKAAE